MSHPEMSWSVLLEVIRRAKSHLSEGSGRAALKMIEYEIKKSIAPATYPGVEVMAYTIWKAVLKDAYIQDIEVPENAELLSARDQHEQLCIWFKCNPDNPLTKRRIAIVGTGRPAPEGARYIGTGFLMGGQLVLHVFEGIPAVVGTQHHHHPSPEAK